MANNKILRNDELQVRVSNSDPTLLSLHNINNGAGVGISMTDHGSETQIGHIRFFHSDGSSQGGGASFHITSTEQDTVLVVGTNTETARIVVNSAHTNSEVDYGFYGDTNTGMYSPTTGQVGLVQGGSRKLLLNGSGVYIQNGNFYVPDHAIYAGNYIYHDGDTDTFIHFDSDKIRFDAGGQHLLQIREGFASRHTGVHSPGSITAQNLAGANMIRKGTDIAVSTNKREQVVFFDNSHVQAHYSQGSGNNAACYDWYTSENVPVDPEKTYEFEVWIKSGGDHNLYVGWHEYNSSGTQISSNPYFHTSTINTSASNINNVNGWIKLKYKLKSHRSSSGTTDTEGSDRYCTSSSHIHENTGSNSDGVMHSTTAFVHIRMGTCYGTANTAKSYFFNPRITEAIYPEGQQRIYTANANVEKQITIGDAPVTPNTNFNELVISDPAHSGISIFSGNSSHGAIYFGDTDHNNRGQIKYLHNTNELTMATNDGANSLRLDSGTGVYFGGALYIPDYIYHDGDTNSYFGWSANDNYILRTAGSTQIFADSTNTYLYFDGNQKLRTTNTGILVTGSIDGVSSLYIADYIYHTGDGNTYLGYNGNDSFELVVGGSQKVTADANSAYLRYQGSVRLSTVAGGIDVSGNSSTGNAFAVSRGSDGASAFRVQNTGEVVTSANYFYAAAGGVSMYVQNTAVFRGAIMNDGSNAPVTIGDDLQVNGNITLTGDLNITGDINSTSVTDLDVTDKTITIAKGAADSAAADGAGIVVDGAGASLLYDHTGTKWEFNKPTRVSVGSSAISFEEYNNGAVIFLDGSDGDFIGSDYYNVAAYGGGSGSKLSFGYGAVEKMYMDRAGNLLTNGVIDVLGTGTSTIAGALSIKNGILNLDDNGDADGVINAKASLTLNIDADANSTGEFFRIQGNTTSVNSNPLFKIDETGNVTIQGTDADTRLVIDDGATGQAITLQSSGSGEGFIKFTDANINRSGGDLNMWTNNLDIEFSTDNGSNNILQLTTSDEAKFGTTQGGGSVSLYMTPGYQRMRLHYGDTGVDFLGYNGTNMWLITNSSTSNFIMGHSWDWDRQVTWSYTAGTSGAGNGIMKLGQFSKNNTNFTHGQTEFYTGNGATNSLVLKLDKDKKSTFFGAVDIYSGTSSNEFNMGRNSGEKLQIDQTDQETVLTAINDSDSNGTHNFRLNRVFAGTGANNFIIQKDGADQFKLDTSAHATFGGDLYIPNKIIHVGDENTWIQFETDVISLRTNGTDRLVIENTKAAFTDDVYIADNKGLLLGTSGDAFIKHTGAGGAFSMFNDIGAMSFVQRQDDGNMVFSNDDGNGGLFTYFTLDGGSTTYANGATTAAYTKWPDNSRIALGSGKDLQIFHNGSDSIMYNGTGALMVRANDIRFQKSDASETIAQFLADSTVKLYYDNAQKFQTTSTGIEVTGKIQHSGLEMTAGTTPNVDQIKEFNMSTQLSANTWTDSGIDGTDLTTGTYVMQVHVSDYNLGGSHYSEFYSATISWYSSGTNETVHAVDEIPIHRAGHAPNDGDVQFRTTRGSSANLKLQVKCNEAYNAAPNQTTGKIFKFKFRRLM